MRSLNLLTLLFLLFIAGTTYAQTGTYQKYDKTGASCTIALEHNHDTIQADIFAWWHTPSGRHGVFSGKGKLKNNICVLVSNDPEDKDCRVTLNFSTGKLKVTFTDCIQDNLLEEFSGFYPKVTSSTPGDYKVIRNKAYFYKRPNLQSRTKAYLVKENLVQIYLENIGSKDWVFINYKNASGKNTSGYMQLSDLKKEN